MSFAIGSLLLLDPDLPGTLHGGGILVRGGAGEGLPGPGKQGITRTLAKEALEVARRRGAFTIFVVVDALTRISGKLANAGERSEVDQKASALLSLAK